MNFRYFFLTNKLIYYLIVVAFVSVITFLYYNYFGKSDSNNIHLIKQNRDLNLELLHSSELEANLLMRDYNVLDSILQSQQMRHNQLLKDYLNLYDKYNDLLQKNLNFQKSVQLYQERMQIYLNEIHNLQQQHQKLLATKDSLLAIISQYGIGKKEETQISLPDRKLDFIIMKSQPAHIKEKSGYVSFTKNRKKVNLILITLDKQQTNYNFDLGLTRLYFRIADPNGNIIPFSKTESSFFEYNNESILFSHMEEVIFSSDQMPIRIAYRPIWQLQSGIYWVYAFCEGIKIAESSFEVY